MRLQKTDTCLHKMNILHHLLSQRCLLRKNKKSKAETNFPKVCDLFMKTVTKKADSLCRPLSDFVFDLF